MTGPWYVTREEVKRASDIESTAYANAEVDRACAAATEAVRELCHRDFTPWYGTRYIDWPHSSYGSSTEVWLNRDEVISLEALTSGGTAIVADDYFLEPSGAGPPYDQLRIDLSSSAAWRVGGTSQRSIAMLGWFGFRDDEADAGELAAPVASVGTTTVDVTDSATVGVGSLLRVGTERMVVRGKTLLTTGQTLQAALEDELEDRLVSVSDGTAFTAGEMLTLDAERVLVEDIAGNNLIVRRAVDGSTLAAHTGSTVYAPRRLAVVRRARGTTAATHLVGAPAYVHLVPALASELALAEAQNTLAQISSKWARQIGAGENAREAFGRGLKDQRDKVYRTYGRRARKGVVA